EREMSAPHPSTGSIAQFATLAVNLCSPAARTTPQRCRINRGSCLGISNSERLVGTDIIVGVIQSRLPYSPPVARVMRPKVGRLDGTVRMCACSLLPAAAGKCLAGGRGI